MESGVTTFRASTANLRGKHELEAFREQFGRAILRLEMTPMGDQPLECEMLIRSLPDVGLAMGQLSPIRSHHPESLGDDGLVLAVMHRGHAEFVHGRHTAVVSAGHALLASSADAATFTGHTPTRLTNIRLKRELLGTHVVDPEGAIGLPIPGNQYALRLLLGYAEVLGDNEVAMDAQACRVVSANIYDLVALAIGGTRDVRAHAGGVAAARLHAIKTDAQRSLGQQGLSITDLARRHGISASYVRRLFATEGTSFTEYLLVQRLSRARQLLGDPRQAHRTIASIAFDLGFGDLSYFNRCFRRRYGMTPSDARAGG